MILGIGLDLADVSRIQKELDSHGIRFTERVFSGAEQRYCDAHSRRALNYAARFAAKEALLKAVGTGLRNGMRLLDIEVANDELGRPYIVSSGKVKERLEQLEVSSVHLSLTHTENYAAAVVVLEK